MATSFGCLSTSSDKTEPRSNALGIAIKRSTRTMELSLPIGRRSLAASHSTRADGSAERLRVLRAD